VSSEEKRLEKRERVSVRQRAGTCVRSLAHANVQHPQAEDAERQKRKGTQIEVKGVSKRGLKESIVVIMAGLNT
jgi:hypothetical protein